MDQGLAAVIAGVAGTIGAFGGAVAGGLAAVRGARVGAETSAQALRDQVRDQAATEHAHWLREQRKVAYTLFITAAQLAQEKSLNYALDPSDDNMDELHNAVADLASHSGSITLIGPESIQRSADRLIEAAETLEGELYALPRTDDGMSEISEESEGAYSRLFGLRMRFVSEARGVLGAV